MAPLEEISSSQLITVKYNPREFTLTNFLENAIALANERGSGAWVSFVNPDDRCIFIVAGDSKASSIEHVHSMRRPRWAKATFGPYVQENESDDVSD